MSEIIVSVDRALDVILTLYNNRREMGVTEISKDLGLNKSTVHRILVTLEKRNFVYQNLENDKYWLGNKLHAIGLSVGEKISLVDIARPYAKELLKDLGEVVNVSILDKDVTDGYKSIIILRENDENKVLSVHPNLGSASVAYASSVGKCLLAFSKDIDHNILRDRPMERFTKNTITDYEGLIAELEKVKENKHAIDNEEQELGLTCVGAPILGRDGYAVAAISISGPSNRMIMGDFNEKISKVKNIADKISISLR